MAAAGRWGTVVAAELVAAEQGVGFMIMVASLGPSGTKHLPFVADVYERGLSLNVMSKSFDLPGLRIGWIACQDHDLLSKMERQKHYLSICSSGPSERLAIIGLIPYG